MIYTTIFIIYQVRTVPISFHAAALVRNTQAGCFFSATLWGMLLRMGIIWVLLLLVFVPIAVFAQQAGLPDRIVPCSGVDCTCDHLIELAQNLVNAGIYIAVFLSAVLFAYAGWQYMTQETIGGKQSAKNLVQNTAIGLVIILAAWLFVDTLMSETLKTSVTWNNICQYLR